MEFLEILGIALFIVALVLAGSSSFIPRTKLLKVNVESIPPVISGHLSLFKVIHSIPFWMLNSFGKVLRVAIDVSALVGLLLLNITYWT